MPETNTHTHTHTHITHTHTRHLNHIVSNVASGGGPPPGLERTKEHLKIEVVIQMTRACSSAGRSAGSARRPANRRSARQPASWSQPMGNTVWKYGTTCIHDLKVLEGRIRVPKISCTILPPRGVESRRPIRARAPIFFYKISRPAAIVWVLLIFARLFSFILSSVVSLPLSVLASFFIPLFLPPFLLLVFRCSLPPLLV